MKKKMPAIFLGHGNPMHAISQNEYTRAWNAIGNAIPRPKAVLSISAHWYSPGSAVSTSLNPSTIHDFGGFPDELYRISYPAPGLPSLADRVADLLAPLNIRKDETRGLDHGTWAVLIHVYPQADIPIVQLSIDSTKPPEFHYDLGKRLRILREEDVLVVGSGNIVHNLGLYKWGSSDSEPYDWALRFENDMIRLMEKGDDESVVAYQDSKNDAMLSAPTPDHFLPLLYVLGLRTEDDIISFPIKGFDGGSISMLAVQVGS